MKIYTCPMHPEIKSEVSGKCQICGMNLVLKEIREEKNKKDSFFKSYQPLIVLISIILVVSLTLTWRDIQFDSFNPLACISYFMIGFFLTFSTFKLMDLSGFAVGYASYDLLAKRVYRYGFIYPFIELFFGLAMILNPSSSLLLWAEVLVMSFSGVGVLIKLLKKEKFQCACLGTFLKVPLTNITLIEDFGMAFLALLILFLPN